MSGRYRDSKGINYPFIEEESQLDKNLHINIDFESITEEDYNIIVLNHQPGIGKTTSIMNYIMDKCSKDDNFSFFYFTDRHKTIDEHIDRLTVVDKNIVKTFEHWRGFGKYCDNELVDTLLDLNVPHNIITQNLNLDEIYNEYLEQFNNTKRVFAPFYYLTSDYFKDNLPEIVFIDERITQIETFYFNKEYIVKGLEQLNVPKYYIRNAKAGNKQFFHNENVLKKINNLYNKKIIGAIKRGTKNFDRYKKFNPYKLEQYLDWSKIYNYQHDQHSVPLIYKALDVVLKNIPLIISDATFNREIFSYFLESYNGELKKLKKGEFKGFNNLNVKILNSNAKNKDTFIYRMKPAGAWPKGSFIDYGNLNKATMEWLMSELHELRKIFGDANIGIISYKELSWLFESMNFDVEYYGSLRGTNRLENKTVLVIIGTWLPIPPSWKDEKIDKEKDYIDKLVEKYFLIKLDKKDIMTAKIGTILPVEVEHPGLYRTKDDKSRITVSIESKFNSNNQEELIGLIDKYYSLPDADRVEQFPISAINTIWYDEIYQAYHRNRGLRDPRIIISYGWFPESRMMITFDNFYSPEGFTSYSLREEFPNVVKVMEGKTPIESVDDKDKEEMLSFYRKQYKGGLMQDLMKFIETKENVDIIAKMFRIHKRGKKRGWNTPPISDLKEAYQSLKDIIPHRGN